MILEAVLAKAANSLRRFMLTYPQPRSTPQFSRCTTPSFTPIFTPSFDAPARFAQTFPAATFSLGIDLAWVDRSRNRGTSGVGSDGGTWLQLSRSLGRWEERAGLLRRCRCEGIFVSSISRSLYNTVRRSDARLQSFGMPGACLFPLAGCPDNNKPLPSTDTQGFTRSGALGLLAPPQLNWTPKHEQ